ncbi:glycosyltransferase family 2 protein [Marinobacterium sp. YM272]|uniref:glycosyltransferase family 2 protein n=1 Tax=Marinobacterium sp. YM272 TaxID=3421654 RepID=UPI003D7FD39F
MNAFAIEPYRTDRWYLISASLPTGYSYLYVWAVIRFGTRECRIPLPASLKGRVFELIPRPAEAHELVIEVESEQGPLAIEAIVPRIVSTPVAWYWMWRRVLGALPALDKHKARRLGIGWRSVSYDPFKTYRLLGCLRYHFPAPDYAEWRAQYWSCSDGVEQRLFRYLSRSGLADTTIPVLLDTRKVEGQARKNGDEAAYQWLIESQESVRAQIGLEARLHVLSEDDGLARLDSTGDWVLVMQPGQRLEPWALAWLLSEAERFPEASLIYSDHALQQRGGTPVAPRFKPDWSLELQRTSHYVGDCLFVKTSVLQTILERLGYVPGAYELALEVGALSIDNQIRHIPAVLWHQDEDACTSPCPEQLGAHLQRHKIDARVVQDVRGQLRLRYGMPANSPKISILIPTRDMLHFLQPCVDSILQKTTWSNYEVLILDNQSSCPDTLAYMTSVSADPRVRVLAYDHPFNFSAINNFGVAHATGDLVCMLNNDTEVISPDWLDEMASRLLQPGVGAVGARLYFSDGRVQHAGDVIGPGGCANHLHGIIEADDPGYMNRAVLPQELSAVTAACLLTTRCLYQKLGGLDEHNLTVAFNDVDFCLRIREAGYRVIYTPYAELYHHESVSRGKDDNPEKKARAKREVQYMRERWADVIERDPFYNPNLNYAKPDFTLGKYPRVDWPW